MKTSTRVIALVTVAALVFGGVAVTLIEALSSGQGSTSGSFTPAPTSTPDANTAVAPTAKLQRFYNQHLDWARCNANSSNECAQLTLPIDYRHPDAGTFQLAVLRVPAGNPDERIGSLVVNPGGPGAPGTSYAASASAVFRKPLTQHFDIVGFDPRGTGSSDPIECLTPSQMDSFLAADPDPETTAEAKSLVTGLDDFFKGCVQRSDALIGHVTTVETARDMDVLRAALGESKLDYFGASYGTKLGATYADLFPQRVGRFVLDGAVDVSLDARQLSLGQAQGFETALRAYVDDCVGDSDCPLGTTEADGLAAIKGLLAQTESKPLATSSGRELTEGLAFLGIITPLYNRDYWWLLTQALGDAFKGDGTSLLRLADIYASRNPDGSYSDNSAQAIYAINCLDDPYALPVAEVPSQFAAFEKASPTLGRVFAWGLVGCHGVQVKATEHDRSITAAGAAPIVVVGTTRDPATPYAWAVALAKQLKSGVLVSRDGDGHTGYNAGNECVDAAVENYLTKGVVPDDGLRC